MTGRAGVLLMTVDPKVAMAVGKALANNGHVLASAAARDPRELATQLQAEAAPIALVDLDPQPRSVLLELERIVERFPGTRFVALSESLESNLLLEAMQAGVRRVMAKQSIESELSSVLNRMSPIDSGGSGGGHVITILSASGGCGATTIAANLAAEVAAAAGEGTAPQPVLLVDLDSIYGALATYFGLAPQYAIDHILSHAGSRDTELIRSTATVHSPQIHVLASPASTRPARAMLLDYSHISELISVASRAYKHVLIDAPRLDPEVLAQVVASSAKVLLVFQLNVKDLRIARSMLDSLDERGISRQHITGIANRFAKRPAISVDDAGKVLNGIEIKTVRNDYVSALEGLNFGKTLSQVAPRSPLRKDLQDLATALTAAPVARA